MKKKITYGQVGDNYYTKDPINKLSQNAARSTAANLKNSGFEEISDTRGESAFVWKQGNVMMASVIECLGTKNLIADEMRKINGKTYYNIIANNTIATIINDLATVGAKPLVIHAYWAVENNDWLQDKKRMTDFITGWKDACNESGATWGGGETPTMRDVLKTNTADLAGSAVGIIKNPKHLVFDKNLKVGDRIIFIKSNGVNENGISLARAVAKKLKNGYATKMKSGKMYGEALLTKHNLYASLVQDLQNAGIHIHYISNITGHGLRKVMRAKGKVTYVIEKIFKPQEVFTFIQKQANLTDAEVYDTYNMGQDYAIFVPPKDVEKARKIITNNKFESINAGYIEKGPRRVIIKPKNITFSSETLDLR